MFFTEDRPRNHTTKQFVVLSTQNAVRGSAAWWQAFPDTESSEEPDHTRGEW